LYGALFDLPKTAKICRIELWAFIEHLAFESEISGVEDGPHIALE